MAFDENNLRKRTQIMLNYIFYIQFFWKYSKTMPSVIYCFMINKIVIAGLFNALYKDIGSQYNSMM